MKTNFHTHTYRCGHADGLDEEYVKTAINADIKKLGFSDHSPWEGIIQSSVRMNEQELKNYADSILELKKKYSGKIDIFLGLECEYFKDRLSWLKEKKQEFQMDYLIFGNHFSSADSNGIYFGSCKDKNDVLLYTKMAIAGMESGLFLYIAHPDLFAKNYPCFDEACKNASIEICKAAKALKIPLEYNMCGLRMQKERKHEGIFYPYHAFWEIAAEYNSTAIIGFDAHSPKHLLENEEYEASFKYLKELNLNILEEPKL